MNSFRTERFLALPFIILLLLSILPVANSEPEVVSTQSFTTIQQAINNANAGDTIIVPAGVYYEHITVNKTVALVGENNKTTIIDGGNTGTVVEVTANSVSIIGFTIRNSGWGWTRNGVLVHYADNCEIRGNYFVHNGHNIRLNYSRASWVVGNVIDGDGYGIRLLHATDCMAVGNSVSNVIGAVHLEFATNCIVKQNDFTRNSQGIRMYSPCIYNTITANKVANNTYDGMIDDSMNGNGTFYQNEIFHNNFANNTYPFINRGTGNIWHNEYPSGGNYWARYNGTDQYSGVEQNQTGSDGIGDTPYTVDGNNVDKYPLMQRWTEFPVSNLDTSRRYASIQDAIDASETLNGHDLRVETGFYLQNIVVSKSLKIIGANRLTTTICGGFTGTVVTVNVNNVSISGFTIHQSGLNYPPYGMDCGILLNHTSGCNISRNIITSNRAGLYLYSSEANIIKENVVSSNRDGLWLWYSGGNVLSGNEIAGNKYNFGVFGGDFADFDNLMDETNAVDNKPVRYIVNAQSEVIDEQIDAGVLYFINCVNVTVRNLNLTKNGHCVFFYNVSDSRVENVTATQSNYGLYLQESNNNTITGNRCMNDWVGVTLQDSGNNVVEGNIVKDCEKGISLYEAGNNSLKRNMLQNNLYGIRLSSSNVNAIFHNNLVENTQQVDVISSYQNAWDNGCEGNYWSNYNGSDLDSDGVGDSYLPWEGLDSYPLVASYIVGDVNHDGRINVLDLIKIGVAYMTVPTDTRWNPHADIAEPYGVIDMGDLLLAAQALVNNGE